MNDVLKVTENCIDVFVDNTNVNEDEFLAQSLVLLRKYGIAVTLVGFDKYKRPIVEINGELHTCDRSYSLGTGERFIKATHNPSVVQDDLRFNFINSQIAVKLNI